MMWPEVPATIWLGVWLGFGLLAMVIVYRKYVVTLLAGTGLATGILHYRRRRNEQMRRMAEVTMMHYTEDPEQKQRIAEKIQKRWERMDGDARRRNGEKKK